MTTGSTEKVRVAVVGCGGMARRWVAETQATESLEIVALVDMHQPAAVAMAQHAGLAESVVYDTLDQALHQARPDAVFDVTIPAAHGEVTLAALAHGCHVLGEKPMSDSLTTAQAMVAAAEKAGRLYGVTQTRRPLAKVKAIERFLRADGLGELNEVHSDFFLGAHFGGFREAMDQPLLVDMAIHTFDNARQIGGADPVSVYCHSFSPSRSWYGGHASAVAIFEMTGGLTYTYRGSWCAEGLPTSWEADWRVIGKRGTLRWDGQHAPQVEVVAERGEGQFTRPTQAVEVPIEPLKHESHGYLIRQFAQAVLDHRRQPGSGVIECPAADNIKSLAMVLAAVESAQQGQKVPVRW